MKPLNPLYTYSDYQLKLTYKDSEGSPIDITGATATMVLRRSIHADAAVTVSGTVTGESGEILFVIPDEDTVSLLTDEQDSLKYLAGAVLTLADETIVTLFQTTVEVRQNIVRA